MNISRNLAFSQSEKINLGVQKASGGAKMAIRGAKLTVVGKNREYKSSRGRKKPIRKTKKKSGAIQTRYTTDYCDLILLFSSLKFGIYIIIF